MDDCLNFVKVIRYCENMVEMTIYVSDVKGSNVRLLSVGSENLN